MNTKTIFRGLFWSVVALGIVFHAAGGWYFSNVLIEDAFVVDPDPITVTGGDYEMELIEYETELGMMDAWYLPSEGDTWVIHVHGLGGTPAEAEPLFAPLQDAGYPQLTITYRNDDGQPEDPSGFYQYGASEYRDISAAVDYALENGAERIFMNAYSTGAAHTLGFAFREVRDRVIGAHFDSPNIDFGETVNHNAAQRDMPILPFKVPESLSAVSKFMTSMRIGVSWRTLDYVDNSAQSLKIPVLVHHGTADLTVPIQTSIEFAQINSARVQLIQVEGAGHVESLDVLGEQYTAAILGFIASLE